MSRFFLLGALVVAVLAGCAERGAQRVDPDEVPIDSDRVVTVDLKVEGMTCTGCENTVNFAIEEIYGVTEVESDFSASWARVSYDTLLVTHGMIARAVTDRGYTFSGVIEE